MSFTRIKQQDHNNSYYTEFVIDSIADIDELPTNPTEAGQGSCAICIENSEVYMLNGQRRWVKL